MRFSSDRQRKAVFAAIMSAPRKKQRIIALDTETTGFSKKDKILEFSAATRDPSGQVLTYHTLINPHRSIGAYAQAVHGITQADVRHAPPMEELRSEIKAIISQASGVAGHNLPFDSRMLAQGGIHIPEEKKICTLQLAKEQGLGNRLSLDKLTSRLGIHIPPEERHHAAADTMATLRCYEKMTAPGQKL